MWECPIETTAAAEAVLSERFAADVRVESVLRFETSEYKGDVTVARFTLSGAPVETAIGKYGTDGQPLANEAAGLRFLSSLSPSLDVVPAFYGAAGDGSPGDPVRLVLLEDLGTAPALAYVLNRGSKDAAVEALEGLIDALVALHLATWGRAGGFAASRTTKAVFTTDPLDDLIWPRLRVPAGEIAPGVVTPAMSGAVGWIDQILQPAGPWHAFSLGDVCPDNNVVLPGGRVRLFDAEFCEFRHALLDLAYIRTAMPTCWCVRRLPRGLSDRLVARYRRGISAGGDAPDGFEDGLAAAQAYWALWDLDRQLGPALHEPDADRMRYSARVDFTVASRRQAAELRLSDLSYAAAQHPSLAPLQDLASTLTEDLRRVWRPFEPLPLYPAFSPDRPVATE